MKRTAFTRLDDRTFSGSHSVLTERNSFREVVFDQESRGERDDLGQFVLAKSFAPRNTDVNLIRFLLLRGDN